jgi:hypothetical protein
VGSSTKGDQRLCSADDWQWVWLCGLYRRQGKLPRDGFVSAYRIVGTADNRVDVEAVAVFHGGGDGGSSSGGGGEVAWAGIGLARRRDKGLFAVASLSCRTRRARCLQV